MLFQSCNNELCNRVENELDDPDNLGHFLMGQAVLIHKL